MKYLVTDQFAGGAGWTADKLARALREPLARISVIVERVAGHSDGGLRTEGLSPQAYKAKFDDVGLIVKAVLRSGAPSST